MKRYEELVKNNMKPKEIKGLKETLENDDPDWVE